MSENSKIECIDQPCNPELQRDDERISIVRKLIVAGQSGRYLVRQAFSSSILLLFRHVVVVVNKRAPKLNSNGVAATIRSTLDWTIPLERRRILTFRENFSVWIHAVRNVKLNDIASVHGHHDLHFWVKGIVA